MANSDSRSLFKRDIQRLAFLRGSLPFILLGPLICLLLGFLLWSLISFKLRDDRAAIEKEALKDAATLSRAYKQQLTQFIEQIDQITLQIKYNWTRSHEMRVLEELVEEGHFPPSLFRYAAIVDRNGVLKSSTIPFPALVNVADRDYFRMHQRNASTGLVVGKPVAGRLTGKTVVQFTRRVNDADGSFAGVIVVSIEPSYFSSFYDEASLGKAGFLAMVGKDGTLRSSNIGNDSPVPPMPALTETPVFGQERGAGLLTGAPWFADRQARFVSWDTLRGYPFVAMVGLSAEEVLASYRDTVQTYRNNAAVGTAFLFLFGLIATVLSSRVAWRQHQAEKAREVYGIASEGGSEGFYMWRSIRDKRGTTVDFEVVDCNERGAAFYGLRKSQLLGKKLSAIYDKNFFARVIAQCSRAENEGFYEDEYEVPPGGPLQLEWMHRKMVRTKTGLAITLRDISEAKAHESELLRLANEDELTGLPNRHWLVNFLPAALERAKSDGTMLGLLFVDLDGFKDVNDTLGHSSGDELLRAASLRLKSILRPTDNVVRFGGDEFAVVLEPVARETKPVRVAERIAAAFNQPFDLSRGRSTVGASIGIALYPHDGDDTETLLKNADIAMYSAKGAGKGHYQFYRPELYESLKGRLDTEQALLQALEHDQFVLFYQPRVVAATGELCSMEALVRWMHPERGLVAPLEFIPLAETTGLILRLGELVFEKACAQIASWKEQGLPLVPVSVNVSARQFNQGGIADKFSACLARYDIASSLIEIEITESSMMGEHAEVDRQLAALRTLGIKLLVDDFGTGYSSLSQLQRLDMDVLKVDRAFTAELGNSIRGEVFFKAIISMAHALGMRVVAEGVETEGQLQVLQSLSCDEIQGFLISQPLPPEDIPRLMLKRLLFTSTPPGVNAHLL
jgi:diguanylate cyclase (GGDEF)-like protein